MNCEYSGTANDLVVWFVAIKDYRIVSPPEKKAVNSGLESVIFIYLNLNYVFSYYQISRVEYGALII